MTNIAQGDFSAETLRRIGVELSKLDSPVQRFSLLLGATIKVYDHVPVRILELRHLDLYKAIQVSAFFRDRTLGDVLSNIAFGFWTLASADRNGERRLWSKKIAEFDAIPEAYEEQWRLLQTCWKSLEPISYQDLKPFKNTME
ncbi:MAG TPA: hypothetical protein VGW57_06215 [Chthoniobacterales bacterium]|nr:hypothetical protein [Chthoniobacterales bacterium]